MKKKLILPIGALLLILACAAAAAWFGKTYVMVDGQPMSRDQRYLDLRGEPMTVAEYEKVRQALPECTILWSVPVQVTSYPSNATSLTVKDPFLGDLTRSLPYFTELKTLELTGYLPEARELEALRQAFPQIDITWTFEEMGLTLTSEETSLDLSGKAVTLEEADAIMARLPELTWADLRDTGLTDEQMQTLADAYPNCLIPRNVTIAGLTISTEAEEMDLSGRTLESLEELENLLPYFRNLKTVDMDGCGFTDAEMAGLNERWDPIRFIWSIRIRGYSLRTDATWFYPYKFDRNLYVNNADLYPLRYCEDMVCIDIGHNGEVTDCEWAAFMPELQYLVIGETGISDLSPLENCKKLQYLEMFTVPVTDYSPLVGCTALEDLNLGKTYGDPHPIAQMTWLKNLWWCDSMNGAKFTVSVKDLLEESLPDTNLKLYPVHPTASGWRNLAGYKAMRDYLEMFYLT